MKNSVLQCSYAIKRLWYISVMTHLCIQRTHLTWLIHQNPHEGQLEISYCDDIQNSVKNVEVDSHAIVSVLPTNLCAVSQSSVTPFPVPSTHSHLISHTHTHTHSNERYSWKNSIN